ncbi:hypothetical protein A8806_108154 [Faecalicatena orotica]|uniref:MBG domain-containing protein n=1 Tax=Faecalicatena orotica TaxID=1544 RepID=A0A2Y9BHU3_9FIRM|nr:MBG domain-containing protein [Faecalicatena orotica]PWJ28639.1 hypothetical protein A8806_108154 [Faecalicatena orotica]SSA56461.1 hypothetical protein SAMN05216536_108154 [Faecalicatena orotica]
MNNKKKQTAAVAMAAVLSVSTVVNPITVRAQENEPPVTQGIAQDNVNGKKETGKETAPAIALPENLQATEGTPLKEIALPENWTWADESTILSADVTEYPAYVTVDDETYDYAAVEGYHAEGHYVEVRLSVAVELPEEERAELQAEISVEPPTEPPIMESPLLKRAAYVPYNIVDVEINAENFPDAAFRKYLKEDTTINPNGDDILSAAEIAAVTTINVYNNADITDLVGIANFSSLKSLYCENSGIASLDVSGNANLTTLYCGNNAKLKTLNVDGASALQELSCYSTGIASLDVSNNTNLKTLKCYSNTNLETLNVNGASALKSLSCYSTGIASLDVSNNTNLETLECFSNTNLETLNVNGASALKSLNCYSAGISSLDVSNNTNLNKLLCNQTSIASLDVSSNAKLETLWCFRNRKLKTLNVKGASALKSVQCQITNIASLDVSNNTTLTALDCSDTPLAYLSLGINAGLTVLDMPTDTIVSFEVTEDTFIIEDKIAGIDKNKVSITSGADYDSTTGVVSNYVAGTPIVYVYDCGTANGVNKTLTVKINLTGLKEESSITVTETLDKTYDKKPVSSAPTVSKTGSTGAITYTWEKKKNDGNWESIAAAPTDAGTYRVTATVAADDSCKEASSTPVEFIISKADITISITDALDKNYDGIAVNSTPTVSKAGGTGAVTYTWEKKKNATEWESIVTAPTDAGTYRVTASVAADDNYNKASSIAKEFIIAKADSSISISANLNKNYDGKAVNSAPTVSKVGSTGAVTYTWEKKKNTEEWEGIVSAPTNAGTYRVTATIAADDNYNKASSIAKEFIIAKADSSISISANLNKNYDGKAVNSAPTVSKVGSTGAVTYTWEKKKNATEWESIVTAPTDAGTYRVTAALAADGNYNKASSIAKEFTISEADSSISITASLDKDYDGSAVNNTPTVEKSGSTGAVTYTWEKKNAADWENIATAPTDAGMYRVTATVAADGNYKKASSKAKEFTISKADSTISITESLDKDYDGSAVDNAPIVEKTGSAGAVSYIWEEKKNAAEWEGIAAAPTDAGIYRVTATVAADDNYKKASSKAKEFIISKADSAISITANLDKDYDGNAVNSTPAVSKVGSTGAITYSWEKKKNATDWESIVAAPTDAGTYRVTATVAADDNYKKASSIAKEFTISKADSTISVIDILDKDYDGSAVDNKPAVEKTGSTGAVTYTWEWKKNAVDWESIASAPTNAGIYRVTAAVAADGNYNEASSKAKEFIISKAENSWTSGLAITGWTYGQTANTPIAVAESGSASYTYSDKEDGTYTRTVPTDAGTWYVKATVAETDNFKGMESSAVGFVIAKAAAPAITLPDNLSGEYKEDLANVVLPDGWTWTDGTQKLTVSGTGYPARFTVDDKNYDYTGVAGYDNNGHYVECMLPVTVSTASNSWMTEPSIVGWTYNETASLPTGDAVYGDVVFTYSDSRTGIYSAEIPETVGTWYMKASVVATTEYTGLDTIVEFNILQAEPDYAVPTDLQAVYGQSLKDITLPAGFTWTDQKLNVGNAGTNEFALTYTPADSNYKTVTDIKVTVTVAKAVNEQSVPLSLAGWTYGGTPSAASAGFRFGQPRFLYSDRLDGTYTDTVPTAAGTWYVKAVVDGTDNYESAESEAVSFVIEPKSVQKNSQIKVPEITADTKLDDLLIKDGDKVLVQGTDYDVTKIQDGNKVTVTITFKGNYTGTIVKTYTVNDKNKPSGKKDDPNRSVQTGDTTSAGLWAMLMTAAAGTAALLKGKKRKEETEE